MLERVRAGVERGDGRMVCARIVYEFMCVCVCFGLVTVD